jgi:hypothetical protein
MLGRRNPPPAGPLIKCSLTGAKYAGPVERSHELLPSHTIESIKQHMGGDGVLEILGARKFVLDSDHVSFHLHRPNPNGVHSITISIGPNGCFTMKCYGEIAPGTFSAPLVGRATQILPDSLATVLGKLTGIETIHHRHY